MCLLPLCIYPGALNEHSVRHRLWNSSSPSQNMRIDVFQVYPMSPHILLLKLQTSVCLGVVNANTLYMGKDCRPVQGTALGPWPTVAERQLGDSTPLSYHAGMVLWLCMGFCFALFRSVLVLWITFLVLDSCRVLEKWYLHTKCPFCAGWPGCRKYRGQQAVDLKWAWTRPALHCYELRKRNYSSQSSLYYPNTSSKLLAPQYRVPTLDQVVIHGALPHLGACAVSTTNKCTSAETYFTCMYLLLF